MRQTLPPMAALLLATLLGGCPAEPAEPFVYVLDGAEGRADAAQAPAPTEPATGDGPASEPRAAGPDVVEPRSAVEPSAAEGDRSGEADAGAAGEGDAVEECIPAECEDVPLMGSETLYPTVLAHGMGGFDELWVLQYWVDVEETLRDEGYAVYTSVVEPINGSDVRGKQLAAFIDRVLECTCAERVNIICHSQGGIDARYVMNVLGYAGRIESVTTLATPHHGSKIADVLLGLVPGDFDGLVNMLAWMVSEIYTDPKEDVLMREALTWVSTDFLAQFQAEHPDDPDVAKYSYAGRAGITVDGKPECEGYALQNPKKKAPMHAPFLAGWTVLGGLGGTANDGMVAVESAKWGTFRGCVPADHVQEIGMFLASPKVHDHLGFFLDHMAFLADKGH